MGKAGAVVGKAGSAVGDAAGGLLKSAGQTAKSAGGRAALTFSRDTQSTTATSPRELAEAFTGWLMEEHRGRADLQQQKPSTLELTELGQVSCFYEIWVEEPGVLGRTFRYIIRQTPLSDWEANFPEVEAKYDHQALIVIAWPQALTTAPSKWGVAVWDQASIVGERTPAVDLIQHWLSDEAGGTFSVKSVLSKASPKPATPLPIYGRAEELKEACRHLLAPKPRELQEKRLLSLAAPGGTGKSYFLKALKQDVGHRTAWSQVDHQGIKEEESGVALLGSLLAQLAKQLEEQSVKMERFGKELRLFRKKLDDSDSPSGFFGHLKRAAEAAGGINPVLGAVNAGVVFLTSWRQEAKEESEALAKDDAVKALTDAFKEDLKSYVADGAERALLWRRPILIFDTYEWLAPLIDTWVRTDLLSGHFLEESRVMVILSGREHLLRTDTRWSEWQHQITNITLRPFDRTTTKGFLESLSVDPERVDQLFEFTEGLPLFLSLAAQIEQPDEAVKILSERVLEEVPREHWLDFQKAALLDHFHPDAIRALYQDKSEEDIKELEKLLHGATFTVANDGKRAFLAPVRRVFHRSLVLQLGQEAVGKLAPQI